MFRLRNFAPLVVLLLLTAACSDSLEVDDPNNASLESLIENPTLAALNAASVGLLVTGRDEYDDRNGMVSLFGILGRESYNFDGSDPRFITEMLEGELNPSSPAFGGNIWTERYSNLRTGQIILDGTDKISEVEMDLGEKEGMRGYTKTMMAFELLLTVNAHDVNGAVITATDDINTPAPIVSKDDALDAIATLLDEGADHLTNAVAGGASLTFTLPSGFAGFTTPATMRTFNRGLAARVDLYRGDNAGALQALSESFVDTTASLTLGVYHSFSDLPGDEPNDLFDPGTAPDIVAHPALKTDAQLQPGGALDARYLAKTRDIASQTQLGFTTDIAFTLYPQLSSPIPIIRNEELILIRSEANFRAGNQADAFTDLNTIRVNSGGLAAAVLDANNYEDELLYNRRYSLMFEGGHRWIDTRRLGRITDLPLDTPGSRRNEAFPIPEAECLARSLTSTLGGPCI